MTVRCAYPLCPFPATRQNYAKPVHPASSPWDAANFVAYCAGHAHAGSWPLVESEEIDL